MFELQHNGIKINCREETTDDFVFDEVIKKGCYAKLIPGKLSDYNWFDIGGHIGCFTIPALLSGATVKTFEPDVSSFKLLSANVALNGLCKKADLNNFAVGAVDGTVPFYVNKKKNKGANSLICKKGRDIVVVQKMAFQPLLDEYRPTAIKIDCEGAEYEIVRSIKGMPSVSLVVMELHFNMIGKEKAREVIETLCSFGFAAKYNENALIKDYWHTNVVFERKAKQCRKS